MRFTKTEIDGVVVVDPERHEDDRGFFARTFCVDEFVAHGLDPAVVQCNISFNLRAGTVRGMHYQAPPVSETKLVRCTRGRDSATWSSISVRTRPAIGSTSRSN